LLGMHKLQGMHKLHKLQGLLELCVMHGFNKQARGLLAP
jgi:hypothetical protein